MEVPMCSPLVVKCSLQQALLQAPSPPILQKLPSWVSKSILWWIRLLEEELEIRVMYLALCQPSPRSFPHHLLVHADRRLTAPPIQPAVQSTMSKPVNQRWHSHDASDLSCKQHPESSGLINSFSQAQQKPQLPAKK